MRCFHVMWVTLLMWPTLEIFAQTEITDTANIILVEGGLDCNGSAREVLVFADLTGMIGKDGEYVGLNAFAMSLTMSDPLFLAALRGADTLHWVSWTTEKTLANFLGKAVLVGAFADPYAPSMQYHIGTFLFGGVEGDMAVEVSHLESSFGSRVVLATGDGPGFIPFGATGPVIISLPPPQYFDLYTGILMWKEVLPEYDLVEPWGAIDILDLVKMLACSQ